ANEKRDIVFSFREVAKDGSLVFDTAYSVRGRITKIEDILRDLRKEDLEVSDETLEKAFRVFEKQSEVDYFINKNARAFLEEQFDLWLYQYMFAEKNIWSAERIAQLQALKEIAYKVIGFISQFEDELVKIWNKPKFVRNSHYILTLDHIIEKNREDLLEKVFNHAGMTAQMKEWLELGMIEANMDPKELLRQLTQIDLTGEHLHPKWLTLPLDTRHFPDLEIKLLSLFDDLDEELNGWLIHSENYQALNSLQPKFSQSVECIHIDPPYNTDTSGFLYKNDFRHSSWMTMMDNRIRRSYEFLTKEGSFISHIDENEYERLFLLLESLNVLNAGTLIWDKRNPMNAGRGLANQHEYIIWRSNINSPINQRNDTILKMISKANEFSKKFGIGSKEASNAYKDWVRSNDKLSGGEKAYYQLDNKGRIFQSVSLRAPEPRTDPKFFIPLIHPATGKPCPVPPNGFSRTPETLQEMIDNGEILFGDDESVQPRQKYYLKKTSQKQMSSVIQEARKGRSDISPLGLEFAYCHPVTLYKELIAASVSETNGIILDYFAGSGTTAHAVMNLNREDGGSRKYILVEMGDYFYDVILPRIKKVAFHSKWKDGKPVFENGESGISQFVKYYNLEQYEETLQKVHYQDADLFDDPNQDPYHAYVFLRDLKLLESIEIDADSNRVRFHPERLYPDIDLTETLSHLRG
ncbi:MAG: DNA methylase N-4/N-6 domain protein, partial [Proteiniphilum acetatigenes]